MKFYVTYNYIINSHYLLYNINLNYIHCLFLSKYLLSNLARKKMMKKNTYIHLISNIKYFFKYLILIFKMSNDP